ncbi:MAG: TraB/GumN family protein [Novosphingobium sp.]|nr:MAG: TraB/GumN family protein [Novosphingobium sp.]
MQQLFRRIACLVLALISSLSITASARTSPAPVPQAPPPAATVTAEVIAPALWKLSDEDTTIWLFGTIHALPEGVDWFHGPVREAFDGSQELVTEITDADPTEMQQLVLKHAVLPQGQSLRGMLTPAQKAAYEKQLGGLGLPLQAFDGYEPWYAAVALSTLPLMRTGYDPKFGVEQVLDARAKELGRKHSGLETPAFQIGLFDSLPMEAQKRYFADVVEQLSTVAEQLGQMVAAWRRGDADTLAHLMNDEEDDPALIEMLLVNRNKAWAQWVKQRLDQPGTVFVAVGAGHLAGPGSLQEQLAAQGFKTTRVQ